MRTDELIVELARSAGPVRPLPSPSIRLARWTAATAPLMALAVIVIGPRADVVTAMSQPAFLGIAIATIGTALLSAASAFVLGIPGAERSVWQRVLPLMAGSLWALALVVSVDDRRRGGAALAAMAVSFGMSDRDRGIERGAGMGTLCNAAPRRAAYDGLGVAHSRRWPESQSVRLQRSSSVLSMILLTNWSDTCCRWRCCRCWGRSRDSDI